MEFETVRLPHKLPHRRKGHIWAALLILPRILGGKTAQSPSLQARVLRLSGTLALKLRGIQPRKRSRKWRRRFASAFT